METIGNIENVKDTGSGIHGAPSELIESELSAETRVAKAKINLREVLRELGLTPGEMKQAFHEIEEDEKVYEIKEDGAGHA